MQGAIQVLGFLPLTVNYEDIKRRQVVSLIMIIQTCRLSSSSDQLLACATYCRVAVM